MLVTVVTLFPDMIHAVCGASILGRAQSDGALTVRTLQLRDFATDKHKSVDDSPAGGGAGMVLKVDVVTAAVRAAIAVGVAAGIAPALTRVRFLDARGPVFSQQTARTLSTTTRHLIVVCGRYEGFDHRCFGADYGAEVDVGLTSIGDIVLTGGELSAMVVVDAVARLLPGVLGNDASTDCESHGSDGLLEHRHYTRPVVFEGHKLPAVLLSGDHKRIDQARHKDGLLLTRRLRPDLFVRRRRSKASDKLLVDDRVKDLDPEQG